MVDDISTTPSTFGQVEAILINIYEVVRWFIDSNSIIHCIPKTHKISFMNYIFFILDYIQLPQMYTLHFFSTAIGNVHRSCLLYYISL